MGEVRKPQITERAMPDMEAVRARYAHAQIAGEHAEHSSEATKAADTANALHAVRRSWADLSALHDSLRLLAADLLAFAQAAGVPDTYWVTDRRIARACAVLGLDPVAARDMDWMDS